MADGRLRWRSLGKHRGFAPPPLSTYKEKTYLVSDNLGQAKMSLSWSKSGSATPKCFAGSFPDRLALDQLNDQSLSQQLWYRQRSHGKDFENGIYQA